MREVNIGTLSILNDVKLLSTKDDFYEMLLSFLAELYALKVITLSIYYTTEKEKKHYFINSSNSKIALYTQEFDNYNPFHPRSLHFSDRNFKYIKRTLDKINLDIVGTEKHYKYLLENDYYYTIMAYKRQDKNTLILMSLIRSSKQKDFDRYELSLLNDLLPHFANLIETNIVLNKLNAEVSTLLSTTREKGCVFVDNNYTIISFNKKAQDFFYEINPNLSLKDHINNLSSQIFLEDGNKLILFNEDKERFLLDVILCKQNDHIYLLEISPEISDIINDISDFNTLTFREKKIVRHISKGLTNKQIAELMFISENTVKVHLRNIYRKTEVTNRASLIRKAMEKQTHANSVKVGAESYF